MIGDTRSGQGSHPFRFTPGVIRRFAQVGALVVVQALALFVSAGRVSWLEGWAYMGLYLIFIAVNAAFLAPKGTALIEERARMGDLRAWDRVVMAVYSLSGIAALVTAGLDERFGWTRGIPVAAQASALVLMALGYGMFSWAMVTNAYFSAAVRIQDDRGHRVVTAGPYRFVRHPGYMGILVFALVMPFMFGSYWAIIPVVTLACSIVARTRMEDRMLQAELDGYIDYARKVRYRLVPKVW